MLDVPGRMRASPGTYRSPTTQFSILPGGEPHKGFSGLHSPAPVVYDKRHKRSETLHLGRVQETGLAVSREELRRIEGIDLTSVSFKRVQHRALAGACCDPIFTFMALVFVLVSVFENSMTGDMDPRIHDRIYRQLPLATGEQKQNEAERLDVVAATE